METAITIILNLIGAGAVAHGILCLVDKLDND